MHQTKYNIRDQSSKISRTLQSWNSSTIKKTSVCKKVVSPYTIHEMPNIDIFYKAERTIVTEIINEDSYFAEHSEGIIVRVRLKTICVDCPYIAKIPMLLHMRDINSCHVILAAQPLQQICKLVTLQISSSSVQLL